MIKVKTLNLQDLRIKLKSIALEMIQASYKKDFNSFVITDLRFSSDVYLMSNNTDTIPSTSEVIDIEIIVTERFSIYNDNSYDYARMHLFTINHLDLHFQSDISEIENEFKDRFDSSLNTQWNIERQLYEKDMYEVARFREVY